MAYCRNPFYLIIVEFEEPETIQKLVLHLLSSLLPYDLPQVSLYNTSCALRAAAVGITVLFNKTGGRMGREQEVSFCRSPTVRDQGNRYKRNCLWRRLEREK